ncbi:hypothetical protein DSECCO2_643840 [anaerobic digester metagenome]
MDVFTLIFWVITLVWLGFSLKKDKGKTLQAIKMSGGLMKGIAGDILGILLLIGLILTFVPPETINATICQAT